MVAVVIGIWQLYGDGVMVADLLEALEVSERRRSCKRNGGRAVNLLIIYTSPRMRIPSVSSQKQPGPYATLTSKSFESRKGNGLQRFRTRVAQESGPNPG